MKELPHSFPEGSEVSLCTACLPATLRAAVNPLAATPGCMHGCSEQNSSSEPDPDLDPAVTAETEQQPRSLQRRSKPLNIEPEFSGAGEDRTADGKPDRLVHSHSRRTFHRRSGPIRARPRQARFRAFQAARNSSFKPLSAIHPVRSITRVFNQHRFIGERLLLSASGSRARGHERWSQPL